MPILENLKSFIFRVPKKTTVQSESVEPLTLEQKLENQKKRVADAKKEVKGRFAAILIEKPWDKPSTFLTPAIIWFVWEWGKYRLLRIRLWP